VTGSPADAVLAAPSSPPTGTGNRGGTPRGPEGPESRVVNMPGPRAGCLPPPGLPERLPHTR
jgi:hypothetical protein